MKEIVSIILLGLIFSKCSIERSISVLQPSEKERLEYFTNLDHKNQLQISNPEEPGEKLWLCINFISKETKQPIINERVKLYHTSNEGNYEPENPADESTARLNGTVLTDEEGAVFVKTILPGDYGSSANNRHIHTTINNAKPEAYDIHFLQYTGKMGERFIAGSDQHFLAELKRLRDSILVTFLTIEVKNYRK